MENLKTVGQPVRKKDAMSLLLGKPAYVDDVTPQNCLVVKVLRSPDKWYGVTYQADRPLVAAALAEKTARGEYPRNGLWEK